MSSELVSCLVWSYHNMHIHLFFGARSSKSVPIASSSESEPEDSDAECLEPSPPKRHCGSSTVPEKCRTTVPILLWGTASIASCGLRIIQCRSQKYNVNHFSLHATTIQRASVSVQFLSAPSRNLCSNACPDVCCWRSTSGGK